MNIGQNEQQPQTRKVDTLSTFYREGYYGGSLYVDARAVGAPLWSSMVAETQKDGIERGLIVSNNNGKIITSKVFIGRGTEEVYDGLGVRKRSGSFTPPFLPHGLKSLLPSVNDTVLVHTHAMPPKIDHLLTTTFSNADITDFILSKYHALVAIDRGGAHLLVRRHKLPIVDMPDADMVKNIVANVIQKNGEVLDVITELSKRLNQFGLEYLYTHQLVPDSEGIIHFKEPSK